MSVEELMNGLQVQEDTTKLLFVDRSSNPASNPATFSSIEKILDGRVGVRERMILVQVDDLTILRIPVVVQWLFSVFFENRGRSPFDEVVVALSARNHG